MGSSSTGWKKPSRPVQGWGAVQIEAARKRGRNGARDAAAILLAYRHGLRASELCSLRWSQVDLQHGRYMLIGPKAARRVSIHYMDRSYGPCDLCKATVRIYSSPKPERQ